MTNRFRRRTLCLTAAIASPLFAGCAVQNQPTPVVAAEAEGRVLGVSDSTGRALYIGTQQTELALARNTKLAQVR